ncbi:trehalose-phosphatase [Agreia pratensis]|uniref:Trehalose 6-phosphate phosphatase n=1 Tax=Agreia pratensis TaxID=150121 RepID=A0A1X7IBH2_9MICO|nr:trehalose-phosphatase [Agreia pratensis]MBF4633394.1 trehalose-phosphatase [Agreia pratensis]SMG11436.1 trehalose 6-phosphatase [Agreia pratensis]
MSTPSTTASHVGESGIQLDETDELIARLRELARTERLLVALDFDGTLAPEVDVPSHARALPEARRAVLELLKLDSTRVALISGRAMESLEQVSDLPDDVLLVGSHGVEIRLDSPTRLTLDTQELAQVDVLSEVLEDVADRVDDVWIESKPAGFALHTRLASDEGSRQAHLMALAETKSEIEGLTVREGKNVLEFSIRSTTKGEALLHLKEYTKATAVFYAGDDVTDEDAFAVLRSGDFGLKSGSGKTIAEFRVSDEAEVAQVLAMLGQFRAEARMSAS